MFVIAGAERLRGLPKSQLAVLCALRLTFEEPLGARPPTGLRRRPLLVAIVASDQHCNVSGTPVIARGQMGGIGALPGLDHGVMPASPAGRVSKILEFVASRQRSFRVSLAEQPVGVVPLMPLESVPTQLQGFGLARHRSACRITLVERRDMSAGPFRTRSAKYAPVILTWGRWGGAHGIGLKSSQILSKSPALG